MILSHGSLCHVVILQISRCLSMPFLSTRYPTCEILSGHCHSVSHRESPPPSSVGTAPPRPYNPTVCPATTATHIPPRPHLHCRRSSPAFCPHHHLQSLDARKFSQPTKNGIHSSTLTPAKSFPYHDSLTYLT